MNALQAIDAVEAGALPLPAAAGGGAGFARWIEQELSRVNTQLQGADRMAQDLALGEVDNLHHVMIEMEKAKLSLQLLLQVRNHVLDAYQEVVRMQL